MVVHEVRRSDYGASSRDETIEVDSPISGWNGEGERRAGKEGRTRLRGTKRGVGGPQGVTRVGKEVQVVYGIDLNRRILSGTNTGDTSIKRLPTLLIY